MAPTPRGDGPAAPTARFATISFLSDYGLADEFVGVVKSVIRSIAPHVTVVDVTHEVAAHDVRAGGFALARSAQYLCPGVVLAVVDPGVGTERRAVAIEVGDGQSYLVGPDNGLLAGAVAMSGGATRAVTLTNADYHLAAPGGTFAGRDVFAPVAAHLCNGVPIDELGDEVDTHTLVPALMPITHERDGALVAQVLWIDRYGNCQLNVDPGELPDAGVIELTWDTGSRTARRARAYDDIAVGDIGLVTDSYGLVSLAAHRASAARDLGLRAGAEVRIRPTEEGSGTMSPVTLRGRTSP